MAHKMNIKCNYVFQKTLINFDKRQLKTNQNKELKKLQKNMQITCIIFGSKIPRIDSFTLNEGLASSCRNISA